MSLSHFHKDSISSVYKASKQSSANTANFNFNNISDDYLKKRCYTEREVEDSPKYQKPSEPINFELKYTNSTDIRIQALEKRVEKTEKLIQIFESMTRLKEEEKETDFRIESNNISDLAKRIERLENSIKIIHTKVCEFEEEMNNQIDSLEKKYKKYLTVKSDIGDFYASKIAEVEHSMKTSEISIQEEIDKRIENYTKSFQSKIFEALGVVTEVKKNSEEIGYGVTEGKESIRMILNDHNDFLNLINILKERSNGVEFALDQITEIKQKYQKILVLFDEDSSHRQGGEKILLEDQS